MKMTKLYLYEENEIEDVVKYYDESKLFCTLDIKLKDLGGYLLVKTGDCYASFYICKRNLKTNQACIVIVKTDHLNAGFERWKERIKHERNP